MDFGSRLKELREEKHFGVNQLALKSGVSAAQISRFENGKRKDPQIETVKKLAKALDVSITELIGSDSDPNKHLGAKGSLVATHIDDDASDEDIEDILNYIEMRRKNPLGKK